MASRCVRIASETLCDIVADGYGPYRFGAPSVGRLISTTLTSSARNQGCSAGPKFAGVDVDTVRRRILLLVVNDSVEMLVPADLDLHPFNVRAVLRDLERIPCS
jgi:hypothetical protein